MREPGGAPRARSRRTSQQLPLAPELDGARPRRCATASTAAASGSGPCSAWRAARRPGRGPEELLPAAAAVELVHTFSHGPRRPSRPRRRRAPARPADVARAVRRGDGDPERRRAARAGVRARALLSDAGRRARADARDARDDRRPVRTTSAAADDDLARAARAEDRARCSRRRSAARSLCGEVPTAEQAPWRGSRAEFGLLFQIVDDMLDEDGLCRASSESTRTHELAGRDRARRARAPAGRDPGRHVPPGRARFGPETPRSRG